MSLPDLSGPTTADPVLVFLPPGVKAFDADVEIKNPASSVGEVNDAEAG